MTTEPSVRDLERIDDLRTSSGGGVDLVIQVHGPLSDGVEEQQNLLAKVKSYLCYINSATFRRKYGVPTPESTSIVIEADDPVAEETIQLIERMEVWAMDNGASIRIES